MRFEVRPNDDGTIDEVVLWVGDRCVFHLEQMDDDAYWFALYPHDDDPLEPESFWMRRHKKRLLLHHEGRT